jgi:SAM-dependent methyltransferase
VTWDPLLYGGSAAYYARGRVPYPPELATALTSPLRLDGTGRLLDVGCGPGSLTLLLAPLFEAATGVDADRDMIAAARAADPAVDWRVLRAEELPAGLGTYRVVTFAQSFHWMDRPRVAAAVRGMLAPGGSLVHVGATTHEGIDPDVELPFPRPPRDAVARLVEGYLGSLRRAGQGVLPQGTSGGEDVVFRWAGFAGPHRIEVPGRVVSRSVEEVASSIYSLSSSAPHLFGGRLAEFDAELRTLLVDASADGCFSEQMRSITLSIWR